MTTYRNEALHLSYTYPSSYTDASSLVGTALQTGLSQEGNSKDLSRCLTVPFSAMEAGGGGLAVVLLGRADAACMKKNFKAADLPDFTQNEVQGLVASGARTQFGQPLAFTADGRAAELLRGTFELPTGQALHAMVVCILLKPDVACWQFLGSTAEKVSAMAAFPVSVDGAPATPVVPSVLLNPSR